jgi:hypothetical protein
LPQDEGVPQEDGENEGQALDAGPSEGNVETVKPDDAASSILLLNAETRWS